MSIHPDKDRKKKDVRAEGLKTASRLTPYASRIIDLHTHGIGGYDTRNATADTVLKIAGIHGAHGVSAILPTIYPTSIEKMRADMGSGEAGDGKTGFGVRRSGFRVKTRLTAHALRLTDSRCSSRGPFSEPCEVRRP